MEISKARSVSNSLVFSSLFLSVICFAGLIHVEIELHVHRQMLQVLNQPGEEKIEPKSAARDEISSLMKILLHITSDKGELRPKSNTETSFSIFDQPRDAEQRISNQSLIKQNAIVVHSMIFYTEK